MKNKNKIKLRKYINNKNQETTVMTVNLIKIEEHATYPADKEKEAGACELIRMDCLSLLSS